MTTTKPSRLSREIAEMAGAQRRLGIMDEATYEDHGAASWRDLADRSADDGRGRAGRARAGAP
ncbi:hypothetical protein [Brucella pituitosa]|uniref:hypothetical protein n=1 Tax=Brucella pituitosa TaxID=571256 RepID=UPI0020922B8E|nr:hypothetical protein [Brucella pituitosa]